MKRLLLNAIVLAMLIFAVSCESKSERSFRIAKEQKVATEVVNDNVESIVIETLSSGYLQRGIYKVSVDSANQFIIVKTGNSGQGVAIARLK